MFGTPDPTTTPHQGTSSHVTVSLNHPCLLSLDPSSVRIFLRDYDAYARTVIARAKQVSGSDATAKMVLPVDLKYCVDTQLLTSTIELGFIGGVSTYESLTDQTLRTYLNKESKEFKLAMSLSALDELVSKELKMNMNNRNAKSRMQQLFVQYHALLAKHGLKWIVTDNQKLAVAHVLSAIRPMALKERLEADFSFLKHALKKNFQEFLTHGVKLSEAFQLVDAEKPSGKGNDGNGRDNKTRSGNPKGDSDGTKPDSGKTELPLCLWPPHDKKDYRHLLKECRDCPENEKHKLLAERAKKMAEDGPATNTRSKTAKTSESNTTSDSSTKPTAGRVSSYVTTASCDITLSEESSTMDCKGRCDDGSDDSIISPRIANAAVLNGIGKITSIPPVHVQVALKAGQDAQSFSFSRKLLIPRLVLHLSAGQLALMNVSFLITDDELSTEDLLIGRPVLAHLGIDSQTLLEQNRQTLDGTDCSHVRHVTESSSTIGRLLIARMQQARGTDIKNNSLSDSRPRSNYYVNRHEPDPFPDPSLIDCSVEGQAEAIDKGIDRMLSEATEHGFSSEHMPQLRNIVTTRRGVFRIGFTAESPAKLPPLRIKLRPEAKPTVVKLRRYSESQRQFLRKLVAKLLACDYIYANPNSQWACAPHLVPKAGEEQWRFTSDSRPVNRWMIPINFPMPVVEHKLQKAKGAKFYGNFDMRHSFWEVFVHDDDQELNSIITPDGIYTSKRLLHGHMNATAHLHSSLVDAMSERLRTKLLLWVDDIVIPGSDIHGFLKDLTEFLDLCLKLNIKLHPDKCHLFRRIINWCGRQLSAEGVRYDPRQLDTLEAMSQPANPTDLLHFTSAMQWLRASIPDFTNLLKPLLDTLERAYKISGRRTKQSLRPVTMDQIHWSNADAQAFIRCKHALQHRSTLAHRDYSMRLAFYTDASDESWAGIVTQFPESDSHLPHEERNHQPLAFLSGHFTDTQKRWSTIEKEAFAIMASVERMHWLASDPKGFDLYTDHNDLIFIFDPLSLQPDLSQAAVRKVLRWAIRFSSYKYVCLHIKGVDNIWADMLSRWKVPNPCITRRLVVIPPLSSSSDPEFVWPDETEIAATQTTSTRPLHLKFKEGLWYTKSDQIWIPDNADQLQLHLCTIARTGAVGHRAIDSTTHAIAKRFYWSTLAHDVKLFVNSCIHCIITTGGETVPRPFGPALHGTCPNNLIQFDYIKFGPSSTADKYIFMIKDDFSGYCWMYPTPSTAAEQAAQALVDWCAAFGCPSKFMSDSPTHFKNETIRLLAKFLKTRHHFTLPYTPWSNGAMERLGKEIFRSSRALLSELQLPLNTWPDLVPVIQSALNNSPSPQRKNVSPLEIFTGRQPTPPINTFLIAATATPMTINEAQAERTLNLSSLQEHMAALHPMINTTLQYNRTQARKAQSRGELPNFTEGDYVLVAREELFKGEKLCLRWRGPRRVIKALSKFVFQIEDLRNGTLSEAHGSRLKMYSDSSLNQKAIFDHITHSEHGMPV